MKKLRKLMALCAVAGMATFLTGCGDDDGDDDDNGGGGVLIPTTEAQLRAQQYTLNIAGDPNARVLIFPQQNRYEITTGTNTVTGAYSNPTFANNQWTVTLSPDQPDAENPAGNLVMTFAPQGGSGTFSFTPTDGSAADQGTFTYTALSDGTTDGSTDGTNGGEPEFAPADQAGLTANNYTATTGAGSTVLTFPTANTYELTMGTSPMESGSFTANRTGEEWTLNLVPSGEQPDSTVTLTFDSANTGTLVYTPVEGTPQSGSFVATGGTTDGTSDGTTDGGTGNNNAPADIAGAWDMNVTSGPYVGTYIATFGGGSFTIVRATDSNPAGEGTYTYTTPHNGNTDLAHLVLNYTGEFAGDKDDYVLTFSNQNAATFSGTVSSGGQGGEAAGGTLTRR